MRRTVIVATATLIVAACSGGGSTTTPTGAPSSPPAEVTAVAPETTEPAATTTTVAPLPVLPAGAQLPPDEDAVVLPPASVHAEHDGTVLAFAGRDNGVKQCPSGTASGDACTIEQIDPWVSVGSIGGTFTDIQVDSAGSFANPAGFGVLTSLAVTGATYGSGGWVAVGTASLWDSLLYYSTTRRAAIWHSADGMSWQRIDVRDIVGDTSVLLRGVEATPTGYVAIGEIAQPDLFDGPSRGLVLTSPDGVTWTKAPELTRQWSVATRQVLVGERRIVVTGVEYVCDGGAGAMNDFSVGAQFRAWASDDNGASFQEVALAGNGAVEDPLPPPSDPAACPDMFAEDANYRSDAGFVALDGDRLLLVGTDGGTVAATDDLSTWVTTTVPDAVATEGADGSAVEQPVVVGLYRDDVGLVLLELQLLRHADGTQVPFASQVRSWRGTDDGPAWLALPLAQPTTLGAGSLGALRLLSDGRRAFLGTRGAETVLRFVEAGELQPWGTCEPAADVSCRFVEIDGLEAAGANLSGVDFTGAVLTNAVLDGADLTGAVLAYAQVSTIAGADWSAVGLAGADLTGARLTGMTLAGGNLSGAVLTDASVPGSVLLATLDGVVMEGATFRFDEGGEFTTTGLAGKSLAGVSFYGNSASPTSMRNTDFSGTTLKDVAFADIDLTGANFTAAIFDPGYSVTFLDGVTCPDGAPPTDGVFDRESCRL
ncbi:MAG: pentapeptide repeat-containing protein [Ilumatobacteraceae bacterium]